MASQILRSGSRMPSKTEKLWTFAFIWQHLIELCPYCMGLQAGQVTLYDIFEMKWHSFPSTDISSLVGILYGSHGSSLNMYLLMMISHNIECLWNRYESNLFQLSRVIIRQHVPRWFISMSSWLPHMISVKNRWFVIDSRS